MRLRTAVKALVLTAALMVSTGCAAQTSGTPAGDSQGSPNTVPGSESASTVPADSRTANESSVDSTASAESMTVPGDAVGLAAAQTEPEDSSVAAVDTEEDLSSIDDAFYAIPIPDDIFVKMQGKSYKDYCTIPREDLRYLHVLHKNLAGDTLEGEMVCHEIIAEDLLEIFRELYDQSYPIEKIRLVDEYDADDETSMTDNNSSCFNYRTISHTNKISKHGLGVAVDINTLYNPYTKVVDGERIVEPAAGEPYLNRSAEFPYKLEKGDLCYTLFISHGFEWGGDWTNVKDYQHFELPGSRVEELLQRYSY